MNVCLAPDNFDSARVAARVEPGITEFAVVLREQFVIALATCGMSSSAHAVSVVRPGVANSSEAMLKHSRAATDFQ